MIGSDNKEYLFLLKGHEDLRQDERVIQIFNLVNLIMAKEKTYSNKNLFIPTLWFTALMIPFRSSLITTGKFSGSKDLISICFR